MGKQPQVTLIVRKRTQLLAKLKAEAQRQSVTALNIQHQFAFDMLLTRLFSHADCPWVLKGGTSLLLRIGSGRRSKDIDLARKQQLEPALALAELRVLVNDPGPTDPDFSFILQEPVRDNHDPDDITRGSFKVVMNIGAMEVTRFHIDLSTQQHLDTAVDYVPLSPVIEHEGLPAGTQIVMVAVENVVADKLCACYEYHPDTGESTRFHDLIDLVRIVTTQPLEAEKLRMLILREARHRPLLVVPDRIVSPGPRWEDGYPRQAALAADFPRQYHALDVALDLVGECLNAVLSDEDISGVWDPLASRWN